MHIRSYHPSDCSTMAQLFYDTVHTVNAQDYTSRQLDAWADGHVDLEAWDHSFRIHRTLVAEEAGILVGFGDIDLTGYLDHLYVHRDYQHRGIATALCCALEQGYPTITTHASLTAMPFFAHRGYRILRRQKVIRRGVLLENYVMERSSGKSASS